MPKEKSETLYIPPSVMEIATSMLDKSHPKHIQENHRNTLVRIKSYCEHAMRIYDNK